MLEISFKILRKLNLNKLYIYNYQKAYGCLNLKNYFHNLEIKKNDSNKRLIFAILII